MAAFAKPLAYLILGLAASDCACQDSTCPMDSLKLLQAVTLTSSEDRAVGGPQKEDFRHLQNFHATGYDRYPLIFSSLKELVDKDTVGRKAKLLSFGCSHGEECHSLRKYFPDALIHGVDISKKVIAKAIANNTDPSISFFSDTAQLSTESYDAVLAMGVLCHQGDSYNKFLSHERFSQAVAIIDRLVRPGGYLVTYNADHTFDVYPRHASFANVCQGSSSSEIVDTADNLYDGSYYGFAKPDPKTRGICPGQNKFCIDSGWVPKKNAQEKLVQEEYEDFACYGCKYPGPFFRKLSPLAKEQLTEIMEEEAKVFKSEE